MLNALRLTEGVSCELFEQRTGLPLELIRDTLEQARELGLLEQRTNMIRPTSQGLDYLNDLMGMFLHESADVG